MSRLLIDTSGPVTTVALARDEQVVAESVDEGRPAAQLHHLIHALLTRLGAPVAHLSDIGVVVGPGSWTGLNIGVTAAKTLAQVLSIPVLPLSTLDVLAAQSLWTTDLVCAVVGAGRGRVYRAWYVTDTDGHAVLPAREPGVVDQDVLDRERALRDGQSSLVTYGMLDSAPSDANPVEVAERLMPSGLLRATAGSDALDPVAVRLLVPDYMQATLAERDFTR